MSKVRAFIAVELPKNVCLALYQAGGALSERLTKRSAVRWVPEENLHVTLRFLGDTDPKLLDRVAMSLDDIGQTASRFELQLGKLGCFPRRNNPRVIWVDLSGNLAVLEGLQAEINESLSSLGWPLESRRFHPHITFGRVKDSNQVVRANFPWGLTLDPLPVPVKHISLISSDLRPSGAVYTIKHRSQLSQD